MEITTIWCLHKFPHNAHFACATSILSKWIFHLVCGIDKVLALHHPSITIFKGWLGNMSKWDQGYFFHISFSYLPPNICYLWTLFFHLHYVHVMVSNSNGEPPHQLINLAPTSKTLYVKRNQHFRAYLYYSIFVYVFWLERSICQKPTIHDSKTPYTLQELDMATQ